MGTDQGADRTRSMCRNPRPGAGSQCSLSREGWEDSCSLRPAPAGAPGPALQLSPCLRLWQEETAGSLGTRTAGRGRDVVTFFPAPHGKEMTSVLHKWDFLCSWKIDINAVFDDVSPGGMGAPPAARCAHGQPRCPP